MFHETLPCLLCRFKCPGMEFYRLADVFLKIIQAMIAGIKMKLVRDSFSLKLPMQRLGAFLEAIVIVTSAVEIDRDPSHAGRVLLRQRQRIILPPMRQVNRITKN